jgi:hypothetical protein
MFCNGVSFANFAGRHFAFLSPAALARREAPTHAGPQRTILQAVLDSTDLRYESAIQRPCNQMSTCGFANHKIETFGVTSIVICRG